MNLKDFVIIVIFYQRFIHSENEGWNYYKGSGLPPHLWKRSYKSCGGHRQSPINIKTSEVEYWEELNPVTIRQRDSDKSVSLQYYNISIILRFSREWLIGFNNEGCLKPITMHWHWGADDSRGSEHTFDGVAYSLEAHLVTWDCDVYASLAEAYSAPNGHHIFAMLFKIGEANPVFDILGPHIKKIVSGGISYFPEIPPIRMFPKNLENYYRYEGSSCSPPCRENAIWTVFEEIQTISSKQLEVFRLVNFGDPGVGHMVDNFRPVNIAPTSSEYIKRTVYASFNLKQRQVPWFFFVNLLSIMAITYIFT